jgi:hypothetical protein
MFLLKVQSNHKNRNSFKSIQLWNEATKRLGTDIKADKES